MMYVISFKPFVTFLSHQPAEATFPDLPDRPDLPERMISLLVLWKRCPDIGDCEGTWTTTHANTKSYLTERELFWIFMLVATSDGYAPVEVDRLWLACIVYIRRQL